LRIAVFTIALAFTAVLAALTVQDLARHGVTVPAALALAIVVLLMFGIVGALLKPPRG
jgi:predicted PurR-regulated permease PerM